MMSRPQMIGVPVSIADILGGGAESFWDAVRGHMSAWLVEAIQTALEHEIAVFAGAGWHERSPESRTTYRCGYRPRRFTVLGHDVAFRMPRVRQAGFRSEFLGYRAADRSGRWPCCWCGGSARTAAGSWWTSAWRRESGSRRGRRSF